MSDMLTRLFLVLATVSLHGKEVRIVLVRLYASEILLEKITIEKVPAVLRAQVNAYLEEIGAM